MVCSWCRLTQVSTRAKFCSRKCRQAAFRLRRSAPSARLTDCRLVMAYADPPYPGLSAKYYRQHADFAGEVNHAELIADLERRRSRNDVAGWALSTSSEALSDILRLCPDGAKVCSWHKLVSPGNGKRHDFWEPLIVVPGRPWRDGFRNVLEAAPARGGADRLIGRKPIRFLVWMFEALGLSPSAGDELLDLFPGTGGVLAAWHELSARAANDGLLGSGRWIGPVAGE